MKTQWNVTVLVKRYITITVEASDEMGARAEAEDWNVVGDEVVGDTIDVDVLVIKKQEAAA